VKTAVLLVNLGSPDSPSVPDVRRYLREFLLDPRVIDGSWLARQLVVNLFILPKRPKESAHAYQSIWTEEGSPLISISKRAQSLLQKKTDLPVFLAMRYGKPSIPNVLREMLNQKVDEILLIPLYPHYAMSSYETVVERVREVLREENSKVELKVMPPFYNDPSYIEALVASANPTLNQEYDHVLFSFHGLPEHHLKMADKSKTHCLVNENCCNSPDAVHDYCYRAQAFKTVELFVKATGIPSHKYSISFQSRLGRNPWLKPYTDVKLKTFPSEGIKKLVVISAAFVADCLETIEELGIRGRDDFIQSGGKEYHLVPCLNEHPLWIEALSKFVIRLKSSDDLAAREPVLKL
jgi:protoporphyrin/coproporphyrin ferrochelatase